MLGRTLSTWRPWNKENSLVGNFDQVEFYEVPEDEFEQVSVTCGSQYGSGNSGADGNRSTGSTRLACGCPRSGRSSSTWPNTSSLRTVSKKRPRRSRSSRRGSVRRSPSSALLFSFSQRSHWGLWILNLTYREEQLFQAYLAEKAAEEKALADKVSKGTSAVPVLQAP